MILDHTPGMITSIVALVIYALIRDGFPRYKRWRVERNGGNPGHNPGNSGLIERVTSCEADIKQISDSCTRTETLWEGQKGFNERMEKHVEKIHARIDDLRK